MINTTFEFFLLEFLSEPLMILSLFVLDIELHSLSNGIISSEGDRKKFVGENVSLG